MVPGIAHGPLWAPERALAMTATNGMVEQFADARRAVAADLRALPEDMRTMYEALLFDPVWDDGFAAVEAQARALATLDDPYLRARAHDLEQLEAQLLRTMRGVQDPPPGAIVLAADMSALELQRWSDRIAGLVLLGISPMAHLAILARGFGVPTIALADRAIEQANRDGALLDAVDGWVETAPPAALLREHPPERISAQPDPGAVVIDGRRMAVYANVAYVDDAAFAASLGADGIGLLRTEFLYTGERGIPTLEEETAAYARIAQAMAGRPIVVRTLDLGADKMPPSLVRAGEDYGMLGLRGIRLLLRRPELFERHVRAVLGGFAGADVRIMLPMIALPEEFVQAREVIAGVAEALGSALPPLGIMFEIPSVAYAFTGFARAGAAFVSIGTNDLGQYFFAADRLNGAMTVTAEASAGETFRAFLERAIGDARDAGLTVSVCGEAAGEAAFTDLWVRSGVDALSVAPGLIPWLKRRLREGSTT